jgi:hypothetical protein
MLLPINRIWCEALVCIRRSRGKVVMGLTWQVADPVLRRCGCVIGEDKSNIDTSWIHISRVALYR